MNIRIYVIITCILVPIFGVLFSQASNKAAFKEGYKKGVLVTPEGHLSLYSYTDDFSKDTRNVYAVRLKRDSRTNEWGYIPLKDRAGVYYSEKKKALVMEAGKDDRVSLSKQTLPLKDFFLEIRITPRSVYAPNGTTYIILYAGERREITAVIPGNVLTPVSVIAGTTKPAVYRAEQGNGYSGISDFSAQREQTSDTYIIPDSSVLNISFSREGNAHSLYINKNKCIEFKRVSSHDISTVMIVSENQSILLNSFRIAALDGLFISSMRKTDPFVTKAVMDVISDSTDIKGYSFKAAVRSSNLLRDIIQPSWPEKKEHYTSFPVNITGPYKQGIYFTYNLKFTMPSDYFLTHTDWNLPCVKAVRIKETK